LDNQKTSEPLNQYFIFTYVFTVQCKVLLPLHLGNNNDNHRYRMGGIKLESVCEEQDIGVFINTSLKFSHQFAKDVSEANRTLGMIKRPLQIKIPAL